MAGPASWRPAVAGPLAALCLALAVTGCSAPEDEWTDRGEPIAPSAEPAPSRPADLSVVGLSGLRQALESRVVATAGLVRPIKSDCNTLELRPSFTCKITYAGEVVTYEVTTSRTVGNSYNWEAKPNAMVATRLGVEAAVWREYADRASAIRCEPGMPDQQRVAPKTALPQRCYFKPVGADVAFGRESSNNGRTVAVTITIYDGSIGLDEQVQ